MTALRELVIYAWVGEDELGSGELGLKQAVVPAGTVAMVAIDRTKLESQSIRDQLQAIANKYGKARHLVRLSFAAVVSTIEPV